MKKLIAKSLPLLISVMVLLATGVLFVERNWTRITASASTSSAQDLRLQNPALRAGLEALRAGDARNAIRGLKSVPPTDPGYAVALANLGRAYQQIGERESAWEAFRTLTTVESEDAQAWIGRAWTEYGLGRFREAEFSAMRSLELDPTAIPARYDVAFFRIAQGNLAEAIPAYSRAFKRDQFSRSYLARAMENLRELHETRPELPAVHYALAFFANALGWRDQEVTELEHFLALEPSGPAADAARSRLERAKSAGQQEASAP